ncbi:pentatricopeptide repeat-containing protein At5g66520 [Jatropha curcas]|uniref:pentatricopeptide repeat-containing protein At5g66520 n=1 Tax=Jatropha curcas TaxID=180498 RepID=UPI0005FC0942|nr:pentatricopeptide repeat-containing protein At5g66520 [Jatropha curcas]
MTALTLLQFWAPTTTPASNSASNAPKAQSSPIQAPSLNKCSNMAELRQFHSQLIRLGLSSNKHVITPVIKFCSVSDDGDLLYATKLFDTIPEPDAFVYNIIIKGYLQHQLPRNSILLYFRMLQDSVMPNGFTFPSVIRAACLDNNIKQGNQIHAQVLKFGFGAHVFSLNNLIYMYMKFQAVEEARRIFDRMPDQNFVSWTSLISGYSQWGFVDEAFEVFQSMPERNSASWNAMMAAFVQNNRFHEAFALFNGIREEVVVLDKFVAASMLSACAGLGALEQGKWIHTYIENNGVEMDSKLATALIDMYCKCGSLEKAFDVFNSLPHKEISSWNCMIGGLAMHGQGEAAIMLFEEMERAMVAPDNITFVNVLSACAHSGSVEEGRYYFRHMTGVHGIEPRTEHFGCMVDLLGRAGMLEEARKLIDEMPMNPDATVLGALLGACKNHRSIVVGEEIGKRVIELEPHNSGRYVLLANLYANAAKWEDVANVRKLMSDRGVKKIPGISVIQLEGTVNEFVAGGRTHPQSKEIYAEVDEMLERIKSSGYVPDISEVPHDLDEEDKENSLHYHSEKLAIAFGLLRTKPGETLHISKNLRTCKDCHQASKLISKLFDREIIIRDRHRFHHFKGGKCSCKDYW